VKADEAPGRNPVRRSAGGTRGQPTAREIAERLWPGPDPADFCRREAIAHLEKLDGALRGAVKIRTAVDPILWGDISRLHIRETQAERLLLLCHDEIRRAEREATEALDFLAAARSENELCFYDERSREREEKAMGQRP